MIDDLYSNYPAAWGADGYIQATEGAGRLLYDADFIHNVL
jgi:hypothetical protein